MSMINNQRRSLLQRAAIAGAVVSLPLTANAAIKPVLDQLQREEFPIPDFASHLAEPVSIRAQDGSMLSGTIESVEDLSFECSRHQRPDYLRSCAKAVRFTVAGADGLGSELYTLNHATLGEMELLLTVVPSIHGEVGLEAIFN